MGRRTWLVLPAYNEAADLPKLLSRIVTATEDTGLGIDVLVVDDGSSDATADIASQWADQLPLRVMAHSTNLGLGRTLRDGLRWACELAAPGDVIVTLDADNSHTPELILRMTRMIREGHDVVIASRYQPGSRVIGVPPPRRLLSRIASIVFRILFPIRGVKDYTCGYRAYRAEVLQRVTADDPSFFDQDGFQAMVDILLKLRRDKSLLFGEVPLILRYDMKEGASKMHISATIRSTLRLIRSRLIE